MNSRSSFQVDLRQQMIIMISNAQKEFSSEFASLKFQRTIYHGRFDEVLTP